MSRPALRCAVATVLLLLLAAVTSADDARAGGPDPRLAAADQLYRAGKLEEAESSYRALLKSSPGMVAAETGLVRTMLREQKLDEPLEMVNAALAERPNSAALLAAKGDVQFRRGELGNAEISYIAAIRIDPKEGRAYLGLARIYTAYSLYRRAYDELLAAHEYAPNDVEVQREWLKTLPRKERLAALEAYLAGPHPDDERETAWLREYVNFLKASVDKPAHACRLTGKVERTQAKLEVMWATAQRVRGVGLTVRLNGHNARLLLDTGAGGILVSRRVAEKAHLTRISAVHMGGIGDRGLQSGYVAVADQIRIGELQFEDCVVRIADQRSVADEDGLIGTDVLRAYLVDLDLPDMRLNLSPLPKRPDESAAPASLNSEGEEPGTVERRESPPPQPGKQGDSTAGLSLRLPKDRYVAPEMAQWTRVFRFGNLILVPTRVNELPPMLFCLDTGGFTNILSVRAGRQVTKVSSDETLRVRGINGYVKKVYSADKAVLEFGRLRQKNLDVVTLNLSNLSRNAGTEISGLLGFSMLRLLEIKLDYRDGLVDFEYNPEHVQLLVPH